MVDKNIQNENQAVRAKEMNAYLMDSQGIDRTEIAQKLCIQKGTVDKWVAKVKNALQISIDHTAEARRRHKAMLNIADKALLAKLPDDNRLLTEFYKGTGTWTNKHEITGTLAHIDVKELIDIIKQESTGSPVLRDIEDSLVDVEYDIVDDDSPQDNEIRLKNGNKIFTNRGDEPLQSGYDGPQDKNEKIGPDNIVGIEPIHDYIEPIVDLDQAIEKIIEPDPLMRDYDTDIPEGSTPNAEGVGIILESNKTLSPSLKNLEKGLSNVKENNPQGSTNDPEAPLLREDIGGERLNGPGDKHDTSGDGLLERDTGQGPVSPPVDGGVGSTSLKNLEKAEGPIIYNPETGETITDPEKIKTLLEGSNNDITRRSGNGGGVHNNGDAVRGVAIQDIDHGDKVTTKDLYDKLGTIKDKGILDHAIKMTGALSLENFSISDTGDLYYKGNLASLEEQGVAEPIPEILKFPPSDGKGKTWWRWKQRASIMGQYCDYCNSVGCSCPTDHISSSQNLEKPEGSATLNPDMATIYDERLLKFAKGEITLDEAQSGIAGGSAVFEGPKPLNAHFAEKLMKGQDHATNCTQEAEGSMGEEVHGESRTKAMEGKGSATGPPPVKSDSQLHAESELKILPERVWVNQQTGEVTPLACDCETRQKGPESACKAKTSVSPPCDTVKSLEPSCSLVPEEKSGESKGSGANPFTPTPDKIAEKLAGLTSDGEKMRFIALMCDEFHFEKNGYCTNREYRGDMIDETQVNSCKYMGCPFAAGMRLSFHTGEPVKFHKPLKYGRKAKKGRKRKVAPLKFVGE